MLLLSLFLFACKEAPEPAQLLDLSCAGGGSDAAEACFKLGTKELNAPRPDYSEARRLFSMGCGVHHPASCNALGTLVRDARGGPKDMVRAANLFEVACDKDVLQACVHYAEVLAAGDGIPQDVARAVTLYTKACEAENAIPKACTRLGEMYKSGEGVEKKDLDKANELFEKACTADFAPGCVARANEYIAKPGKDNLPPAVEMLEKACQLDANFGCFELAELHRTEKAPEANPEQAGHYYQSVCRLDPSRGCYELAELMAAELVPSRPGEKEALYKLACESGNSDACTKR